MGDNKLCSSCGNDIPADAVFCPNCGSVQAAPENTSEAVQEEVVMPAASTPENPENIEAVVETAPEQAQKVEAIRQEPVQQPPAAPEPAARAVDPQPAAPQKPQQAYPQQAQPQQAYVPPQQQYQPPQQPQQAYAQAPQQYPQQMPGQYYQQPPYVQPQTPPKPKKKFPWVFTILWVVMLVFVGVWAFLWTTYPESQKPIITIDTLRVVSVAVSAVLLIYTLNLKLATKKLKALPTILLILCLLISAFMFCAVELIEGDFAHDVISPITDNIFPIE